MKLIATVSILTIIMWCPLVMAHTESDPCVVDIIAGGGNPASGIDVGDVNVFNDANFIYVTYRTDPNWMIAETHLHLDPNLALIPQTKTHNPKPGKFDYTNDHDPLVSTFTYMIPIDGWTSGTELCIAAHSVVVNTATDVNLIVVSGCEDSTQITRRRTGDANAFTPVTQYSVCAWEPGPLYPNDGPDDSAWQDNSLWDQGLSDTTVLDLGADWIWEAYRVADPVLGTVLTFERTFKIEGYPKSGTLYIACDNGYEAFVNTTPVADDNVYGDWLLSDLKQAYVDVSGWQTVGIEDILGLLTSGYNVLSVNAANEYFDSDDAGNSEPGTVSSNPGGLIYALNIVYNPDETGWAEGFDFGGRNWSMYFNYTIQGPVTADAVTTNVTEPQIEKVNGNGKAKGHK